jgi:hypothetical protein
MMGYAQTAVARCSECDGLRKACSAALGEYIRILAERSAARKRRDHDLVEAFEEIETESLAKCQNAQQAIFDHEVTHVLEKVGETCKVNAAEVIEATELLSH